MVNSVEEIVAATRKLSVTQFHALRRKLDLMEAEMWKVEQSRAAAGLRNRGITHKDIDRMVKTHRREGRR
jgi:hypothetical protein